MGIQSSETTPSSLQPFGRSTKYCSNQWIDSPSIFRMSLLSRLIIQRVLVKEVTSLERGGFEPRILKRFLLVRITIQESLLSFYELDKDIQLIVIVWLISSADLECDLTVYSYFCEISKLRSLFFKYVKDELFFHNLHLIFFQKLASLLFFLACLRGFRVCALN